MVVHKNGNIWGQQREGHEDVFTNCAFIYKTRRRLTAAAATSECQGFADTSFLRYKISRSVAKRRKAGCPTGGGEQCAEDFWGRKKREGATQPVDSGLTRTASAAGQVETGSWQWQLPVSYTGIKKKKTEEEKVLQEKGLDSIK